ncbi:condensation domain-containing protein [Candidatus Enterococcus mansonii]|uniref:Carrier domain-containing protein n=1 Tax=Candidatus Enterococcus mansonii TaxID=1834181 RepID=A0A242CIU1_9ENTE|nr:condensation domain-containing protein [Enterococcus sp. 4G2_DIV0659]OTO10079.1 hypothetical protein A5880_000762 [Enterococcus sp. 4G2_DIV0659]
MENIEELSPQEREQLLQDLMKKNSTKKGSSISKDIDNRYKEYGLSDVQKTYWAGNKGTLELGGRLSNIYASIVLNKGSMFLSMLIKQRIQQAIESLVNEHDILRTIILEDFMQKTLDNTPSFKVEYKNYGFFKRKNSVIEKQKKGLIETEISYSEWPLLRVVVINWKNEIDIQFGISPLLMDGNGVSLFLSQLIQKIMNMKERYDSNELSYRDYVIFSEKQKKGTEYARCKKNKLSRLEILPQSPRLPMKKEKNCQEFIVQELELLSTKEWENFKSEVIGKSVTAPAVLLTLFTDAVTRWTIEDEYYVGMINTYHLPEMKSPKSLLGNFNTIDFIEVNSKSGTFFERVKNISNQFAFNYDNGRFSGFEEIRQLRKTRQLESEITFPVGFNCTINIPHPSASDFFSKKEKKTPFLKKLLNKKIPTVNLEELNIYTTQLPFIPTMALGEQGELICKFARYQNYFAEGVLEEIISNFKHNAKEVVSNKEYWEYSWKDIYKKKFGTNEKQNSVIHELTSNRKNSDSIRFEAESTLFINLKKIYLDIIGDENISSSTNLFCFGMDSIQVIRFIERVKKDLLIQIPPKIIYESQTLGELTRSLERNGSFERKTI